MASYPNIGDHGLIGDLQTAALGASGSFPLSVILKHFGTWRPDWVVL